MVGPDIAVARRGTDSDDVPVQHLLLAIEISDTSLRKDIVQKARLYGAGGVAEYWVVDLENRKLHVHGGPGSKGYGAVAVRDWDEPVNPLFAPELALDLGAILRDLQ